MGRVKVRVGISIPLENAYPWQGSIRGGKNILSSLRSSMLEGATLLTPIVSTLKAAQLPQHVLSMRVLFYFAVVVLANPSDSFQLSAKC